MPRKGPAPKRPIVNDPVYGSPVVTQLVSKVLLDGKKATAQRIVYTALEGCREKTGTDPVVTLKRAMDNVKPAIEVKSRRVGGATYQVPVEVRASRRMALAMRWLIESARKRLLQRAERISRPAWRASFLERVPENARTLSLAHEWVGDEDLRAESRPSR